MRKITFAAFVLITGFFLADSHSQFTVFSAKNVGGGNQPPVVEDSSTTAERDVKDRQLAAKIRQLTNRSTEGLVEKRNSDGSISLDLENRFQNLMLSKVGEDGEPLAACVTSVEEANDFFGRNLETGEPLFSNLFQGKSDANAAAQHGMSESEFEFYKKLIADAAVRRAASPNAATLTIVNGDGAGEGFNDATVVSPEGSNNGATRGDQRLNLFNFAAGIWGAYLDSNVAVNVNSQFNSQTPCSTSGGVLGSAGTTSVFRNFPNAQFSNTWHHAALANKRAGSDLNGATPEINAIFNSDVDNGCLGAGSRFYYGLDNLTPAGRINLLIVLLHEMGHGLGFSSFVNGSTGALFNGFPDIYTRYMFDRSINKYWFEMTNAERQTSAINATNVLWDGPSVKLASAFLTGGRDAATGRVQLYTPTTFVGGGSISHWNTNATPNLLMEPNINPGIPLSLDLTRQQMRDIGWYRDTTADLIPDAITNVRPSGGTLVSGSTVTITWMNTGEFNRNVTIDLSTDGGLTYPTTLATDIPNNGSFTFTVPNAITSQGRVRVREHNFAEPVGLSAVSFAISTTAPNSRTLFDFDGDGKADLSVFRPASGNWFLNQSANGFTAIQFGASTDKIVPADYDGDGKTDVAVYRSGTWYLNRTQLGFVGFAFGDVADIAVPADYTGDGRADLAVFRPSNGTWYIYNLANNQSLAVAFGASGDKPVSGDYDADGKADLAVFRPSTGIWYVQRSSLGFLGVQFGDAADKPVPADYDGDGETDLAVFRPSNGTWYLYRSQFGLTGIAFGTATDTPTAADYDGDGKTDVAVFRPSDGIWYLLRSQAGFTGIAYGTATDQPIPSAYVP